MATTSDDVWTLFREVAESQKDATRSFQKTDRKFQDTNRKFPETGPVAERTGPKRLADCQQQEWTCSIRPVVVIKDLFDAERARFGERAIRQRSFPAGDEAGIAIGLVIGFR